MVTFNFTYDPGITVQQALGFEMAGRIWSHFLSDPVTLNFHVGVSSSLPTNVIGGALPGMLANTSYETFRGRLQQDATSTSDHSAGLPTGSSFSSSFELVVERPFDEGGWVQQFLEKQFFTTNTLNVTRAGGKAVGLIPGNATALDGAIVMGNLANSQFHWNYNFTRNTTAPTGSLDFLSVAIHEIGHLLGFVSGVDKPGVIQNAFLEDGLASDWGDPTTPPPTISQYWENVPGRMAYVTPLDLFRVDIVGQKSMTYGSVYSNRKGFAPQSGSPAVAPFSQGKDLVAFGDGYQASHWEEQATALGIMDPAIAPRERASIKKLDLQAFDAIGWNLRNGLNATTFTTTFLNNLRTQAVSSLATRLGQTTTWINNNLTTAPTTLGRDRTADVETMVRNSLIYEWGTTGSGTTSTSGRRWMEIFNQMASAQEVYVNFSTVSKVAPPQPSGSVNLNQTGGDSTGRMSQKTPGISDFSLWGTGGSGGVGGRPRPWGISDFSLWGTGGSGGVGGRPRPWSASLGAHQGLLKDFLSGMNGSAQLVGHRAVDALSQGDSSFVDSPVAPFNSNSTPASKWDPRSAQMNERIAVSELISTVESGSRQQPFNALQVGLNTLLGAENNPLVQNSLSVGLMGAIK